MTNIALFPSVLGVRPGIREAADMLRSRGHSVHVIDLADGRVFDDYPPAMEAVESMGYPALMAKAAAATADLPEGFVTMGFSNGAGVAVYIGCTRPGVVGIVMLSGGFDPAEVGAAWPAGLPGQTHNTKDDPWRDEGIEAVVAAAKAADAEVQAFDYPGSGHLFADASKVDEFQPAEAELMWSRVLDFLDRIDATA